MLVWIDGFRYLLWWTDCSDLALWPWWTVTGLGLDLVGFAILAVDLLRESRRRSKRARLRRLAEDARKITERYGSYASIPKAEAFREEHASEIERFEQTVAQKRSDKNADEIDWAGEQLTKLRYQELRIKLDRMSAWFVEREWEKLGNDRFAPEIGNDVDILEEAAAAFEAEELVIANQLHDRIPVTRGVVLIMLGFGLQIIGAWPCA